MKKFQNQVVLVTGAGGGIGYAIAVAFAKEGAKLVIVDLKSEYLDKVKAEVEGIGSEVLSLAADVSSYDSFKGVIAQVMQKFGKLDVACNNAGVVGIGSIEEIAPEEWDRVMDINAKGVYVCTKAELEVMKPAKSGAIINTSSIAGKMGMAHLSHYVASKFAVIGFSNSIAKEVALSGVTVNCICPGIVGTGMWRGKGGIADRWKKPGETEEQSWERNRSNLIPQGIDQSPEDIAEGVLYLAGARHVTGQALAVDGGITM
ncbi:SDR family NAD(P)-dependent oxidoreductase [Weeksellaceae bacterium A-14]|uniref:SDR family NAD(P)-dependent oxidoreductase n=1 Tax=Daejeonia sp. YH14 TaxID=3439042 RepID=UPI0031E4C18A